MGTQYLATSRVVRNPVRVQQWNASMRAGDDFKLAVTVYADDDGTPAQVIGSRSQLLLWPEHDRGWHSWDYGLGWWTGATYGPLKPTQVIAGFTTPLRAGGINFAMPATTSACLAFGRYRISLQIDLADGEFSQVEGILQVRERWRGPSLGHTPDAFFTIDGSPLNGPNQLAPALVDGLPVDKDGFFLLHADFKEREDVSDFTSDFSGDFR